MDPGLAMDPDAEGGQALDQRLACEIPRLRGFFVRLSGRASGDLDDLVQESLARALRYRASFDERRALWPWLKSMAFRVFLDHRDRVQRTDVASAVVEDVAAPLESQPPERAEVERLLERLPRLQRDVLVRFHAGGESIRDIARSLGCPEGTIKSHLHRARRALAARRTEEDLA